MNLLSEYDQFELMRIEIYLRNRRDKWSVSSVV